LQISLPSFDPDLVHPRVRHFYEHAAQYQLEAWSDVALVGKFFLWLLVEFISQRMDQLNFPISALEKAGGMTSQITQLTAPATGQVVYTGWLRKLKSSGLVMFAGIYSLARIPGEENPCVKVTFPDRGSANVISGRSTIPTAPSGCTRRDQNSASQVFIAW